MGANGYQPGRPQSMISVAERTANLMRSESPLMQLAKTQGLQAANQRGLLNSSLAVQAAQDAMIRQAVPIASQEANLAFNTQQSALARDHQSRLQAEQLAMQQQLEQMGLSARAQETAMGISESIETRYQTALANINANENLPLNQRQAMLDQASQIRDSSYRLLQQIYGIKLRWTTSTPFSSTPSGPASSVVPPGRIPTTVRTPPSSLGPYGLAGFTG